MLSRRQNDCYGRTADMLPPQPIRHLRSSRAYPKGVDDRDNSRHYSEEPSIPLDTQCGVPAKIVGRNISSGDVRYQDVRYSGEEEYRCGTNKSDDNKDDDCGCKPDESWSDPAIRWSQNRHDGITPASQPLRFPSVHSRSSVSKRPPPRPSRIPSSHCSLPPRASSAPSPSPSSSSSYCERSIFSAPALARRESSSTAPSMPSRMPSTHSTSTQSRRPPSRPVRAPTMHSRCIMEDESVCPSFYDLSVHNNNRREQQERGRTHDRYEHQKTTLTHSSIRSNATEETLLEVAPGVRLPLRRSTETLEAIRNDFYVPTTCYGCRQDLFCIEDAEHCICPCCKTISPLEAAVADNDQQHHGVGIGFTAATLWQTQSDMMAARRRQRSNSIH